MPIRRYDTSRDYFKNPWLTPLFLLGVLLATPHVGCTANVRTRSFGGEQSIALACDTKLVTVTWKETNLWYVTRPMRADETPETSSFQEDSNFGLMQGRIALVESRCPRK